MAKKSEIKVVQEPERHIPAEVLAKSIVDISKSMKQLLASRLNRSAILVLVKADTGIPMMDIGRVIDSLVQLESTYCK